MFSTQTFYLSFWQTFPPAAPHIELIERETPQEIKRVSSVFNNTSQTTSGTPNNSQETKKETSSSLDIDLQSTDGYKYAKETVTLFLVTSFLRFWTVGVENTLLEM